MLHVRVVSGSVRRGWVFGTIPRLRVSHHHLALIRVHPPTSVDKTTHHKVNLPASLASGSGLSAAAAVFVPGTLSPTLQSQGKEGEEVEPVPTLAAAPLDVLSVALLA